MAKYRTVHMSFWTDPTVVDDFTPEDKLFYLYLLSNPHTNLCGCYEVSVKQIALEVGYSTDAIKALINRFDSTYGLIKYDEKTKELLVLNWHKYNWTSSPKFQQPLEAEIDEVKSADFRKYLLDILNIPSTYDNDTVSPTEDSVPIPYEYGSDTSVTVSVNNNINNNTKDINNNTKDINNNTKGLNKTFSKEIADEAQIFGAELSQAVADWLAYKKERRQSYKDTGLKALLNQIKRNADKYGEEMLADVIQRSIANRYEGICWSWLKEKPNNKGRNKFFEAAKGMDL